MPDTITRELVLPTTADEAWRAVTDPTRLADWLADEIVLELVPGGEASFAVDGERREGWIEEVVPPSAGRGGRLAFWWSVAGEPASRVEFELTPVGEGTRLRITETRPLELLDLVGVPLPGSGGGSFGPALVAA